MEDRVGIALDLLAVPAAGRDDEEVTGTDLEFLAIENVGRFTG
jgi:hypothetical protein